MSVLAYLTASRKRAVTLVPLALLGAYIAGFAASSAVGRLNAGSSGSKAATPLVLSSALQVQLLSLVPQAYAAAGTTKICGGSCDVLDPANYTTTSDFYTNAGGEDFMFTIPGEPSVGYINLDSPNKSLKKRFD